MKHSLPFGSYGGFVWAPDGLIAVYAPDDLGETKLWHISEDGTRAAQIELLPDHPSCKFTEHLFPVRLADGRVAFLRDCITHDPTGDKQPYDAVALNLETLEEEVLVPGGVDMGVGQMAWDPEAKRALFSEVNGPCLESLWLSSSGHEIPTFGIGKGNRRWTLDQYYDERDDREFHCEDLGNVTYPTWSWDGEQIAFLAFPAPRGGFDRLAGPWSIYLMDPEEQQPRSVLDKVYSPAGLTWSPKGRYLAFAASIRGKDGMWIFDTDTEELTRVSNAWLVPEWSPEGDRLAAIENEWASDTTVGDATLFVFDVSAITARDAGKS